MTGRLLTGRFVLIAVALVVPGVAALIALPIAAEQVRAPDGAPWSQPAPSFLGPVAAPRTLTAEAHGAVGDGKVDDTAALRAALSNLRRGDTLTLLPGRTYRHSDVLVVTTPGVVLAGPGALLASAEERSALQLAADGIHVRDLTLRITGTTRRWDAPPQHRLVVGPYDGIAVSRVDVQSSAAAGIFVQGAQRFRFDDVRVSDTRADGIHMTAGASGGTVDRAVVLRSGDDGVAVVSYGDDPAVTSHITVRSPTVRGVARGRGLSVVGGEDVLYQDVEVSDTYAAGVYVATEGAPYFTRSTRRVKVLRGSVARANQGDDIDHGALLVAGEAQDERVADVVLADLDVRGTSLTASAQIGLRGQRGRVDGVRLERITVTGGGGLFRADTGRSSWTASTWVVDGLPLDDIGP